jgi:hypothetical protein
MKLEEEQNNQDRQEGRGSLPILYLEAVFATASCLLFSLSETKKGGKKFPCLGNLYRANGS